MPTLAAGSSWHYTVSPYLQMAAMNTKTEVGPLSSQIGYSFADVFKHLSWGAMGSFNAQNDQWAVNLDGLYAKLNDKSSHDIIDAYVSQGIYSGFVAKRVNRYGELYVGARYVTLKVALQSKGPLGLSVSRSVDWVDPVVGFRLQAPINDRVNMTVAADGGGFGVGAKYDFQVWPVISIKVGSGDRLRTTIGYRLNYMQYNQGSGARNFEYDSVIHGPTLGAAYTF